MFGFSEILIVLSIVIIFFGAKHIPALLGSFGKSLKVFKKSLKEEEDTRVVRDVTEAKPSDNSSHS